MGNIGIRTAACCNNIKAILAEAGVGLDRVVKTTVFHTAPRGRASPSRTCPRACPWRLSALRLHEAGPMFEMTDNTRLGGGIREARMVIIVILQNQPAKRLPPKHH
jgi:hypothetical protein